MNRFHTLVFVGFLQLTMGHAQLPSEPVVENSATISSRLELVDIGGRKLQLKTVGSGSPTVVIEAGMGEPPIESGTWKKVIKAISASNRVVWYDRAGLGKSDPATKQPRTSCDVATDLHALLTKAGLPGPYVLVGHSYGGIHHRMFAHLYPDEVAALVLVDASHPHQMERMQILLGPPQADEGESIRKTRELLNSMLDPQWNPEHIDPMAVVAEFAAVQGIGDKPLVILSHHAGFKLFENLPEPLAQKIENLWWEQQTSFKQLSPRSSLIRSKTGGHYVHAEDPKLVIDGIRHALSQISSANVVSHPVQKAESPAATGLSGSFQK